MLFELVYTMVPAAEGRLQYDNGCAQMQYCLNREPVHFKSTEYMIDSMHYEGHVFCAPDFNSGLYGDIGNSPLAEQKNSGLRHLETMLAYMNQDTCLLFMRHWLHKVNRIQVGCR
jgi:hypothetical protein